MTGGFRVEDNSQKATAKWPKIRGIEGPKTQEYIIFIGYFELELDLYSL